MNKQLYEGVFWSLFISYSFISTKWTASLLKSGHRSHNTTLHSSVHRLYLKIPCKGLTLVKICAFVWTCKKATNALNTILCVHQELANET